MNSSIELIAHRPLFYAHAEVDLGSAPLTIRLTAVTAARATKPKTAFFALPPEQLLTCRQARRTDKLVEVLCMAGLCISHAYANAFPKL